MKFIKLNDTKNSRLDLESAHLIYTQEQTNTKGDAYVIKAGLNKNILVSFKYYDREKFEEDLRRIDRALDII